MKNQWIIISFAVAIFVALGSYFCLIESWKAAVFLVFPLVLVFMLLKNPDLFFARAFSMIMLIFLALNKFFFKLDGQTEDYTFQIGSHETGNTVNVFLLILASLALVLHFLKVNGKLEGTLFDFKQNKVGNISGSNNQINQNIK